MGSRYLLVEFDDEATAIKLKDQLDERSRAGRPLRVVGLFAKPTSYCECDPNKQITTRNQDAHTKRGKRFGWWVCLDCKRPTSQLSLVNLLKPKDLLNSLHWSARGHKWSHYITHLPALVLSEQSRSWWNER